MSLDMYTDDFVYGMAMNYFHMMRRICNKKSSFNNTIPKWSKTPQTVKDAWIKFTQLTLADDWAQYEQCFGIETSTGQRLYEVYYQAANGVSAVSGEPLVEWSMLKDEAQISWNTFATQYQLP